MFGKTHAITIGAYEELLEAAAAVIALLLLLRSLLAPLGKLPGRRHPAARAPTSRPPPRLRGRSAPPGGAAAPTGRLRTPGGSRGGPATPPGWETPWSGVWVPRSTGLCSWE